MSSPGRERRFFASGARRWVNTLCAAAMLANIGLSGYLRQPAAAMVWTLMLGWFGWAAWQAWRKPLVSVRGDVLECRYLFRGAQRTVRRDQLVGVVYADRYRVLLGTSAGPRVWVELYPLSRRDRHEVLRLLRESFGVSLGT
ncbi:MAG TPA: hypothetical protein VJS92_09960 [Candidatus Polarisedimenticolaceae bacterium]|nr:hypothetical protein [Candidatus Polarisedimenticolaceae bacterium]